MTNSSGSGRPARLRRLIAAPVGLALLMVLLPALGDEKPAPAPKAAPKVKLRRQLQVLRAGNYSLERRVKPRAAAMAVIMGTAKPTAAFEVTYVDFPAEPKKAFQAAVDVWGGLLTSAAPIRIEAHWKALESNVLGSAGPGDFRIDFAGAPKAQTWYPVALAGKLAGADPSPGQPHIVANFNKTFPNWYHGTDNNTPADKYDFMSVVTHELGHGLGFIGSMEVGNDGQGRWGLGTDFPIVYDHFTENEAKQMLLDTTLFPNPSLTLAGQLTSNHLYFNGANAVAANGDKRVRLYAPATWEGGSSFSHLDETVFSAGDANSLMTPQIGMGEAIHDPGSVGLGILKDIGW